MRIIFITSVLILLCSGDLFSQFTFYPNQHRPPGLNWQELKTDHFSIIFPEGYDSTAYRSARILESQYESTQALTGGSLTNFPVVLTNYNDLTNGFVTSFNFRSEVDLAPFKGKSINPQSGSWLEAVLPHELVHANHANLTKRFSFTSFLNIISPDFGRSINFFAPLGMHEGLAVYHESTGGGITGNSGRSNYTFYSNQYNSINSANAWSLGQHYIISDYTEPGNRHYLGGSHFTHWLHDSYGDDVSKEAIATHQYLFFLGYGFALRTSTGKWPKQLYNDYNLYRSEQETLRKSSIPDHTDQFHTLLPTSHKGVEQRRPIWISNEELLYYSNQYNAPRGFYVYNISSENNRKITEAFPVQDFYLTYDHQNRTLLFPEYFAVTKFSGSYQTDLISLNIDSSEETILTSRSRVYAPQFLDGDIYGLQPDKDFSNLVKVQNDTLITIVKKFEDETPIAFAPNPASTQEFAMILNRRGVQALWLTSLSTLNDDLEKHPDIAFKGGSIHDIYWHPSGSKFLFTADPFPSMNIYEYDLSTGNITQLTNSIYNAFEASYAPDDSHIAYVTQVDEEQKIAILNESDFYNEPVPSSKLLTGNELAIALSKPFIGDELLTESTSWQVSDYKSNISWLKPRVVLPIYDELSGASKVGARIMSTDVLQSQSYDIEITQLQDRFWYDFAYTSSTFFPGFSIRRYSEPAFLTFNLEGPGLTTFLQQEKGVELSIPVSLQFKDVVRSSSISFRPFIALERIQFWDLVPNKTSSSSFQTSGGLFAQWNYRLLQLPRDVQPSSGILFFSQAEVSEASEPLNLNFRGNRYRLNFANRGAVFYGANIYISPFQRLNQSLLLELRALQQSENLLYSTDNIRPLGFSDDAFLGSNNLARFGTRYTIPIKYPDNGGLLIPLYLSSIYTSLFTQTVFDFSGGTNTTASRSIFGAGIHFQFKISNLGFEIGTGFAFDPTDNEFRFIVGDF